MWAKIKAIVGLTDTRLKGAWMEQAENHYSQIRSQVINQEIRGNDVYVYTKIRTTGLETQPDNTMSTIEYVRDFIFRIWERDGKVEDVLLKGVTTTRRKIPNEDPSLSEAANPAEAVAEEVNPAEAVAEAEAEEEYPSGKRRRVEEAETSEGGQLDSLVDRQNDPAETGTTEGEDQDATSYGQESESEDLDVTADGQESETEWASIDVELTGRFTDVDSEMREALHIVSEVHHKSLDKLVDVESEIQALYEIAGGDPEKTIRGEVRDVIDTIIPVDMSMFHSADVLIPVRVSRIFEIAITGEEVEVISYMTSILSELPNL